MDTTKPSQSARRLSRLADVIELRKENIKERWAAKIREDARAANVATTDLKDGIEKYLRRIAAAVRGTATEYSATSAWEDIATEHALTRIRIGFDIEQLVHELVFLRRITVDVLREEGALTPDEASEQMMTVIEAALIASVKSYVEGRDYEMRRREAEHIAFLAHQVRSPLSAAVLSIEQARLQLKGASDSKAIERTQRNLLRVKELLDEVLLAEQLEAGEVTPSFKRAKLSEVLGDVISASHQSAKKKGIEFEAHYDPELEIQTDPKLLLSAVEALLENAIKYTDSGEVSFEVHERTGQFEFHVYDNCPGLSEPELSIIFEPFKRGKSGKAGSGLGLAIVRHATKTLGGEVHAESPGERGCHFWLVIPSTRH